MKFNNLMTTLKPTVKSLLEIENSYELLKIFQLFYYLNGRLPLTNDLMIIPDG